jgi:hypothetical protein
VPLQAWRAWPYPRFVEEWGPAQEQAFIDATVPLAQAVIEACGSWDVYHAANSVCGAASRAMSEGPMEQGRIPASPSTFYLIWAALTDRMDAPGSSWDERAAADSMRLAAREWLDCLGAATARTQYLERWYAATHVAAAVDDEG